MRASSHGTAVSIALIRRQQCSDAEQWRHGIDRRELLHEKL